MTSRSLSIFSSRARTYVAAFIGLTLLLCGAAGGLSYASIHGAIPAPVEVELLKAQRAKLERAERLGVVFLGDSSLGYAIDAALWRELSGQPTLNLALTGGYGYEGTRNMLRHVLRRGRPEVVVITQTLDMITREPSRLGELYTSIGLEDALDLRGAARIYLNFTTTGAALAGLLKPLFDPEERGLDANVDYVTQRPRMTPDEIDRAVADAPLRIDRMRPAETTALADIAALCRAESLTCLYMHGPIHGSYCRNARAYMRALNAEIRRVGLRPVEGSPLCMKPDDVGNALDHVRPGRKGAFTRMYYDIYMREMRRDDRLSPETRARLAHLSLR